MSAVSRVSAFAKRRRLNDDSTAPTSESDDSTSASLARRTTSDKTKTQQKKVKKDVGQLPLGIGTLDEDVTNNVDGNSFAPLIGANAVSFVGTREVEWYDGNSCKVRLSKGQKCSFQGIAKLWVRDGSIRIHGAILTGSDRAYTVFCSASGICTEVVALTKLAEFQVESIPASEDPFPSVTNVPGKLGELAKRGVASFNVLEKTQNGDQSPLEMASDISGQIREIPSHIMSALNKTPATSRILVCGKRAVDTYAASTALVNCLLTPTTDKRDPRPTETSVLLDLDYSSPAFSAPGTISVATLQKPMFGPSYAQPLSVDSAAPNRLVAAQYIKAVEDLEKPKLDLDSVQTLLQTAKDVVKNAWLVIRTGSWFAHMTSSERSLLQKLLQLDLALCIDTNRSSPHFEAAQSLLKDAPDAFMHLPVTPYATSSLQEHKLLLQSHFRFFATLSEMPLWYHDSLPDTQKRRLVLSTNDSENTLSFIQVRGGILRPQDVPSAIYQNLVVVVAAQSARESGQNEDPQQSISGRSEAGQSLLEIRTVEGDRILHYIGLAFVEEVDVEAKKLTLNTPVSIDRIRNHTSQGHEVGLVLEKPGTDGRFGRHLLLN